MRRCGVEQEQEIIDEIMLEQAKSPAVAGEGHQLITVQKCAAGARQGPTFLQQSTQPDFVRLTGTPHLEIKWRLNLCSY